MSFEIATIVVYLGIAFILAYIALNLGYDNAILIGIKIFLIGAVIAILVYTTSLPYSFLDYANETVTSTRMNATGAVTVSEQGLTNATYQEIHGDLNVGFRTMIWIMRILTIFGFVYLVYWIYNLFDKHKKEARRFGTKEWDEEF